MLSLGRYQVRQAASPDDLRAAQKLRALCFGQDVPVDADRYDPLSMHMLVEERDSGTLVCCFRLMPLTGAELAHSYAAQFYELGALAHYPGLMMELGRFCVHPAWHDPDILRIAWAAMTDQVDRRDVQMLFGCSSFEGVDTAPYLGAFARLKLGHLAPPQWKPGVNCKDVVLFEDLGQGAAGQITESSTMPPLLRTYLTMGAWVSDHAVVDHQMNTLHVFTGLEIASIPEPRKRLLRALI